MSHAIYAIWDCICTLLTDTERCPEKLKEGNVEKFNKHKKTVRQKLCFSSKVQHQEAPDARNDKDQVEKYIESVMTELRGAKTSDDWKDQGLLSELAYEYAMCSPEFNNTILELSCANASANESEDKKKAHDDCFGEVPEGPSQNQQGNLGSERNSNKNKNRSTADVLINDDSCDSVNSEQGRISDDAFEKKVSQMYQSLAQNCNDVS